MIEFEAPVHFRRLPLAELEHMQEYAFTELKRLGQGYSGAVPDKERFERWNKRLGSIYAEIDRRFEIIDRV